MSSDDALKAAFARLAEKKAQKALQRRAQDTDQSAAKRKAAALVLQRDPQIQRARALEAKRQQQRKEGVLRKPSNGPNSAKSASVAKRAPKRPSVAKLRKPSLTSDAIAQASLKRKAPPKSSKGDEKEWKGSSATLSTACVSEGYGARTWEVHSYDDGEGSFHPTTVYIGGIPSEVQHERVQDAFSRFGSIVSTRMPFGKTFAFVRYTDKCSADEAIKHMDMTPLFGTTIRVSRARSMDSAKRYQRSGDTAKAIAPSEEKLQWGRLIRQRGLVVYDRDIDPSH